jgi:hypothetical protein
MKGIDHLGDLGIEEEVISKWSFNKYGVMG